MHVGGILYIIPASISIMQGLFSSTR